MTPHMHATALHAFYILAVVIAFNFLVRTVAARHADSPFWQGASYVA